MTAFRLTIPARVNILGNPGDGIDIVEQILDTFLGYLVHFPRSDLDLHSLPQGTDYGGVE